VEYSKRWLNVAPGGSPTEIMTGGYEENAVEGSQTFANHMPIPYGCMTLVVLILGALILGALTLAAASSLVIAMVRQG
jgi:hypothetical protein